ncbi:MAG: PDZ domain-containing protein [Chitinophagaceae bacterium]|nr:PDZ domain-containing protein [Chitinophagaceae bacterium]MCW5905331.1 PDZ domain-containing protein [Chitinophagaceae bacterium]
MKKKIFSLALLSCLTILTVQAQKEDNKTEEKGKKTEKIVVEVNGNSIKVNGKPITEFDDGILQIIQGDSIVYNRKKGYKIFNNKNKALLGVYTESVEEGAKITEVSKKSAAEKAGLKTDDIITKIDDEKVTETNSLSTIISKHKVGDKVMITYIRSGKTATTQAMLEKNNTPVTSVWRQYFEEGFEAPEGNFFFNTYPRRPKIGIQIQDVEEGNGVKILEIEAETPAAKAGLKVDDIITEIEGSELKGVDDLRIRLKDFKEGDSFKVKYKRGNKTYNTDIKLPKKLKKATL